MTSAKIEPLMTVRDAATYCRVTTETIHRWIRSGLPAIQPTPRTTRIRRVDLDKWLSEQEVGS